MVFPNYLAVSKSKQKFKKGAIFLLSLVSFGSNFRLFLFLTDLRSTNLLRKGYRNSVLAFTGKIVKCCFVAQSILVALPPFVLFKISYLKSDLTFRKIKVGSSS